VTALKVERGWTGGLRFVLGLGWRWRSRPASDLEDLAVVDADAWRSAGAAAAGAIIGGVLTGGIGLLAGAALGGRRRNAGVYVARFADGLTIAFEERDSRVARALDAEAARFSARRATGSSPRPS